MVSFRPYTVSLKAPAESPIAPLSNICNLFGSIFVRYFLAFRDFATTSESEETCSGATDTVSGRCFDSQLRSSRGRVLAVDGIDGECGPVSSSFAWLLIDLLARS